MCEESLLLLLKDVDIIIILFFILMQDISFDNDCVDLKQQTGLQRKKGLEVWLVEKGITKDRKGSQYLLLSVAMVAVILTCVILTSQSLIGDTEKNMTPIEGEMPSESSI